MPKSAMVRLHTMLMAHGLSLAAAQRVAQVGERLRRRSAGTDRELAVLIDADTGDLLGGPLQGEPGTGLVNTEPFLRLLRDHPRCVQVHTHPTLPSPSFSEQDAVNLTALPELHSTVVVGADGTWYVLSKSVGGTPALPLEVIRAFRTAVYQHLGAYQPAVRSGARSREDAWRELSHRVWAEIAGSLRLRYDRLEPPEDS